MGASKDTLYLSTYLYNAVFPATVKMPGSTLESVLIACFFIATKYEEIYPPPLCKFSSRPEMEIYQLERDILLEVNFNLIHVSVYKWVRFFNILLKFSAKMWQCVK